MRGKRVNEIDPRSRFSVTGALFTGAELYLLTLVSQEIFFSRGRPRKQVSEASSSSSAELSKKLKPKKDTNAIVVKRGPKKRQKVKRYVDDDVTIDNDVTDAFPFEETSETSEEEPEAVDEDKEVRDTHDFMFNYFLPIPPKYRTNNILP